MARTRTGIMELHGKSPRSRHIVAAQAAGETQSNPATETVKDAHHKRARPMRIPGLTHRNPRGGRATITHRHGNALRLGLGLGRQENGDPMVQGRRVAVSLNAETTGKATQESCPSFEVRFPASVSRRDYALVSWRQTDRRCHITSQNSHISAPPNRAISGREAETDLR